MSCPHSHSDGAYVLGALSPAERSAYEAHLTGCEQCATAVARLAPVPGLLGRVDPAALPPGPPAAPARLPQLLEAVVRQRRRRGRVRRWQLAGAAVLAAVLVLAGGSVWSGWAGTGPGGTGPGRTGDGPGQPAAAVAMAPVAATAPVTAQVATAPAAGGTEVWLACQYAPVAYQAPDHTFRLVAVGPDGASEQLGSWRAAPGDEVTLTGLTRFGGEELVRVELRSGTGEVLLAYRPGG